MRRKALPYGRVLDSSGAVRSSRRRAGCRPSAASRRRAGSPCGRTRERAPGRARSTAASRSSWCGRSVVEPLFDPPAASSSVSNSPSLTWPEPSNIRCSNRCAKPVRPGFSRADPTWYQTLTATCGTLWSSCRMTREAVGQREHLVRHGQRDGRAGRPAGARVRPVRRCKGSGRVESGNLLSIPALLRPTVYRRRPVTDGPPWAYALAPVRPDSSSAGGTEPLDDVSDALPARSRRQTTGDCASRHGQQNASERHADRRRLQCVLGAGRDLNPALSIVVDVLVPSAGALAERPESGRQSRAAAGTSLDLTETNPPCGLRAGAVATAAAPRGAAAAARGCRRS